MFVAHVNQYVQTVCALLVCWWFCLWLKFFAILLFLYSMEVVVANLVTSHGFNTCIYDDERNLLSDPYYVVCNYARQNPPSILCK